MVTSADAVREQVARALAWEQAHVSFDKAVAGLPPALRGKQAPGFDHSPWQLLEHMRLAQHDILDFCLNTDYTHTLAWPDGYWPAAEPVDAGEWDAAVAQFHTDRGRLQALARDPDIDLMAPVPTGSADHTYLRALLLVADHNAYHVGQLVAVRRALGAWP